MTQGRATPVLVSTWRCSIAGGREDELGGGMRLGLDLARRDGRGIVSAVPAVGIAFEARDQLCSLVMTSNRLEDADRDGRMVHDSLPFPLGQRWGRTKARRGQGAPRPGGRRSPPTVVATLDRAANSPRFARATGSEPGAAWPNVPALFRVRDDDRMALPCWGTPRQRAVSARLTRHQLFWAFTLARGGPDRDALPSGTGFRAGISSAPFLWREPP